MAERSLVSAIIPPGVKHINSIISEGFPDLNELLLFTALTNSLPHDFLVKVLGKTDIYDETIRILPLVGRNCPTLNGRVLRLCCVTAAYASLWQEGYDERFTQDSLTRFQGTDSAWDWLSEEWTHETPFRSARDRRQALLEVDVIVAALLGLSPSELSAIYRIQFPILAKNERDTFYDVNGRIVFTVNAGLKGVGLTRTEWNEAKDMKSGCVSKTITDDTLPGGPVERTITYKAPFDRCDREADYATAWQAFEERGIGNH